MGTDVGGTAVGGATVAVGAVVAVGARVGVGDITAPESVAAACVADEAEVGSAWVKPASKISTMTVQLARNVGFNKN
jgi:hypothetical protein